MRLTLQLGATSLEFVEPRMAGAYPWLVSVGTLHLAARAAHLSGLGTTEAASLQVELDNSGRQAATLLGRPLRARADVYDDAGDAFFSGLIASVAYGPTLTLSVES